MKRYLSEPLTLPQGASARELTRADLVFYGVEHRSASYEALVFLNAPKAGLKTPLDADEGYAGSFVIFGHGGCFGDTGHCEIPAGPRDPFDSRPPHGLTPQTKMVDITEALKHPHCSGAELLVTVLAMVPGSSGPVLADRLFFTELRLLTYR